MILATLLLRSNDIRPVAWCIVGFCGGIYLFVQGFRLLQRRHLIADTPVSKIRSASMGLVELSGLAVGPYTMVSPITAHPCYFYRTLVWEWKNQGRSSKWVKVVGECMHVPFFLDDNTGMVMVDPRGADLDLHRDFQQEFCDSLFTLKAEAPPNVCAFLSRHGISTTNKIKVEEFCIKPKNSLFLLGTLDENPGLELAPQPISDPESGVAEALRVSLAKTRLEGATLSLATEFGDSFSGIPLSGGLQHDPAFDSTYQKALSTVSARAVRLSADQGSIKAADMTQQQKIAAALAKAGISNPAAWTAAGVLSSPVVNNGSSGSSASSTQSGLSSNRFDPHPPIVLMKGKNNPTFLISWRSQAELARSLGWKSTLMIWGGPALSFLCLYFILYLTNSL
ncbi:MAG: hypothetical protein WAM69_07330 [Candidatus Sulfotelmatobacter sp.]